MPKSKQSLYFNKAKEDHQSELVEDYVEEIADLFQTHGEVRSADLAQRFGVSAAAVSKFISRLKKEGLVESMPYRGIFLTEKGRELAEKVAHRHNVVFETLIKLGVSEATAHADAEGIEHHCSEETVQAMLRFLKS
ncbi:manganese-binding transcriptional regulator MntR [Vibrio sp. CAIM 722]|uniref:Transcriptional regulator MntR n=1 Tax=Vibrio eleionomae TaxID=2653505 RepID=A0A7X4LMF7_9VIBR|nr:manganese-binding transcriptional regulator MntR [Vibrio eleionomae]MZI94460.1 manganese-binding transcriptional regulator MntR [Vibrio eleionomae]